MRNWLEFFKERTPIASYILITMGPALSAYFLTHSTDKIPVFLAFIGFLLIFLVLRMMDEYKDYDKDVVAHPKRPLPRGLIPLPQFHFGITIGIAILIAFDFVLLILGLKSSFYLYTLVIFHLWLMYKEFYIAEWINQRPLLYAISHELILVTLCLFCVSVFKPEAGFNFTMMEIGFSLSVLFAFFSYEVCRKLNPAAHPVLKTYLYTYGINGVIKIVSTLLVLLICVIHYLFKDNSNQYFFYIPILLLWTSLVLLSVKKLSFKLVEHMATVNLLIFLYSGLFYVIANRTL